MIFINENITEDLNMTMFENTTVLTPQSNDTSFSHDLVDIRQPLFMIIIYSIAYGVIFLFALFGNIAVVVVVSRTRQLQSLTNFFIVNLAVADILVALLCTPITLLQSLYTGKYNTTLSIRYCLYTT